MTSIGLNRKEALQDSEVEMLITKIRRKRFLINRITKAIFIVWLFRIILFKLIQITFSTSEIEQNFRHIWLILIPLSIIVSLIISWNDSKVTLIRVMGLLIAFCFSFCVIFILNLISGMCGTVYSEAYYVHKTKHLTIKYKSVDCGATDSTPYRNLVIIRNLGPYLIKYSTISEEEIKTEEWTQLSYD